MKLNENVSLINYNFQSEAILRLLNLKVERMDQLGIQAFFAHVCPLIAILAASSASSILVGTSEN